MFSEKANVKPPCYVTISIKVITQTHIYNDRLSHVFYCLQNLKVIQFHAYLKVSDYTTTWEKLEMTETSNYSRS